MGTEGKGEGNEPPRPHSPQARETCPLGGCARKGEGERGGGGGEGAGDGDGGRGGYFQNPTRHPCLKNAKYVCNLCGKNV